MDRRHFLSGLAVVAIASPLLVAGEAEAAAPRRFNWVLLGRARVDGRRDRDIIPVGPGKGLFRALRLRVTGSDLRLDDLTVRYGIGRPDSLRVSSLIRQGGQTRAIDLKANRRFIRDVSISYGKFRNGRGATFVELWGER
jgi:hypothetical protein